MPVWGVIPERVGIAAGPEARLYREGLTSTKQCCAARSASAERQGASILAQTLSRILPTLSQSMTVPPKLSAPAENTRAPAGVS